MLTNPWIKPRTVSTLKQWPWVPVSDSPGHPYHSWSVDTPWVGFPSRGPTGYSLCSPSGEGPTPVKPWNFSLTHRGIETLGSMSYSWRVKGLEWRREGMKRKETRSQRVWYQRPWWTSSPLGDLCRCKDPASGTGWLSLRESSSNPFWEKVSEIVTRKSCLTMLVLDLKRFDNILESTFYQYGSIGAGSCHQNLIFKGIRPRVRSRISFSMYTVHFIPTSESPTSAVFSNTVEKNHRWHKYQRENRMVLLLSILNDSRISHVTVRFPKYT